MKKFSFLVVVALLGIGCSHTILSQDEARQAKLTLKEIANHVQDYHINNQQWPAQNDFKAIAMKNPSTSRWKYSFSCTKEKNFCDVQAQWKKTSAEDIVIRLQHFPADHKYQQQLSIKYQKRNK